MNVFADLAQYQIVDITEKMFFFFNKIRMKLDKETQQIIENIHKNLDDQYQSLIHKLDEAKEHLNQSTYIPSNEEIELSSAVLKSSVDNWSTAIGMMPFMLALISFVVTNS